MTQTIPFKQLNDSMKSLESQGTSTRVGVNHNPVLIRLDGRSFSSYVRGLKKPFDERLHEVMVRVTKALAEETGAFLAYTQSDEISLALYNPTPADTYEPYFAGKVYKIVSTLAAIATYTFNKEISNLIPEKADSFGQFDCRVWDVPDAETMFQTFLWRQLDCNRNSISMAAHATFSHKRTTNKNTDVLLKMLKEEANIDWNDYPAGFKFGTFLKKELLSIKFTREELDRLPPQHDARKNPDLEVIRNKFVLLNPELKKFDNLQQFVADITPENYTIL